MAANTFNAVPRVARFIMTTARHRRWLPRVSTWAALVIGLSGILDLALGVVLMVAPDHVTASLNDNGDEVSSLVLIVAGILLLLLARGLLQRRRRAWAAALLVLSAALVFAVFDVVQQGSILALGAQGAMDILLIAALLAFQRTFAVRAARRLSYGQMVAALAVVLALAYGIVGSYLLRDQFHGIEGWSDATYFALFAYVTLSYDYDVAAIYPVGSDARWFVVSMFLIGVSLFVTALSVAVGPIVEGRVKGVLRLVNRFQRLKDHVVVCGYSGVAASIIDELRDRAVTAVIVDHRKEVAQSLRGKGHDVREADPMLRDTLLEAGVPTARAVIAAFDSDSANTLVAVNAKDLRDATPSARFAILVRVEDEENVAKVLRLGVDQVISPSTLGGRLLAEEAVKLGRTRRPPAADASAAGP